MSSLRWGMTFFFVTGAALFALTLLPLLIVAVSSGQTLAVLSVGGAVAIGVGVAGWLRRMWSFDGRVLHLDEGVLVRNQRRIPVERIRVVHSDTAEVERGEGTYGSRSLQVHHVQPRDATHLI